MQLTFEKAGLTELETLVSLRLEVLRAANGLPADADLSAQERASRAYYAQALAGGGHAAYLARDGGRIVGTGGVSFYRVLPTCHNPSGEKAYLMNLYTMPDRRGEGIAAKMLEVLVREARARGVTFISLEATAQGRPLYERYGFVPMEHEMRLP